MLKPYRTIQDVLASRWVLSPPAERHRKIDRVLRSTKLESSIYHDLRTEDAAMDEIEQDAGKKLKSFSALSQDVFQSFYSLVPRRNEETSLSVAARKFNAPILEHMTKFTEKMGWSLFLELDEQDVYNFEGLRIPINNSIAEMDMLVLSLVKVVLDSLNEKEIVAQLTGTYEKLTGSISKLEAWFQEKHLSDYQEHIKFLRNLQELRSSGTGHRKGKSYQKISKVFDIQKGNYAETFSGILENVSSFLNYIGTHLEELGE